MPALSFHNVICKDHSVAVLNSTIGLHSLLFSLFHTLNLCFYILFDIILIIRCLLSFNSFRVVRINGTSKQGYIDHGDISFPFLSFYLKSIKLNNDMFVFFELDIYYQTENCCSGG